MNVLNESVFTLRCNNGWLLSVQYTLFHKCFQFNLETFRNVHYRTSKIQNTQLCIKTKYQKDVNDAVNFFLICQQMPSNQCIKHHVLHSHLFILLIYPELTLFDVNIDHRDRNQFSKCMSVFVQNSTPGAECP